MLDVRTAGVDFMSFVNGIELCVLLARFGIRPVPVLNYSMYEYFLESIKVIVLYALHEYSDI